MYRRAWLCSRLIILLFFLKRYLLCDNKREIKKVLKETNGNEMKKHVFSISTFFMLWPAFRKIRHALRLSSIEILSIQLVVDCCYTFVITAQVCSIFFVYKHIKLARKKQKSSLTLLDFHKQFWNFAYFWMTPWILIKNFILPEHVARRISKINARIFHFSLHLRFSRISLRIIWSFKLPLTKYKTYGTKTQNNPVFMEN